MHKEELAVIILAAGKGTRFGENYTKLLHPIFDKPLIYYPIQNLINLRVSNIFVVVSDPKVEEQVRRYIHCAFVYMPKPTGTADAVKIALPELPKPVKNVLVLNGDDATLYSKKTLEEFLKSHEVNKADISLMTLKTGRNMEVGRVIRDKRKHFSKILEYKEYLESGARSREINCGVYLIDLKFAKENLPKIQKSASGEYYLTDLLNLAKEQQARINLYVLKNHSEWIGINDKKDLKYAENVIKRRNLSLSKDKKPTKSVHFLGIAGSGTSACAKLAQATGFKVTGCDQSLSGEFMKVLDGISTSQSHDPSHLEDVDILAVTPAVLSLDPNNPELLEAKKRRIKIMTWQQFLGKFLTHGKFVIAVSGTHGKSTTTAMIGKMLEDLKMDPTVLLGANTYFWGSNFRLGQGRYFVVEADEFNDNFLNLKPNISVVLNIDYDHPEYFKDLTQYKRSFQNFLHETKSLVIANLDDKNTQKVLTETQEKDESFFPPIIDFSKNLIDFPLKTLGVHNIYNASAAFNLGLNLELNAEKIKDSLQSFPGIGRRMEEVGEINGAKVFSDFGHHPTEIKVTIEEVKKKFPDKKIWLVYQPHMFSRTKALFNEFVQVFKNLPIERAAILDIYPSREVDTGLVNSEQLTKAVGKENVEYSSNEEQTFHELSNQLTNNDLVIFMGAGDIDTIVRRLLNSNA